MSAKIFETEMRRSIDVARPRILAKVEKRPRLELAETETRHETFETKRLQDIVNTFNTKLWTLR